MVRTILSRRGFLASLASILPLDALARAAHAEALRHVNASPSPLDGLGEVVLPPELGKAGIAKTVGGFRRTRFIGLELTQLAAYLVATAYNLVRMVRLVAGPMPA